MGCQCVNVCTCTIGGSAYKDTMLLTVNGMVFPSGCQTVEGDCEIIDVNGFGGNNSAQLAWNVSNVGLNGTFCLKKYTILSPFFPYCVWLATSTGTFSAWGGSSCNVSGAQIATISGTWLAVFLRNYDASKKAQLQLMAGFGTPPFAGYTGGLEFPICEGVGVTIDYPGLAHNQGCNGIAAPGCLISTGLHYLDCNGTVSFADNQASWCDDQFVGGGLDFANQTCTTKHLYGGNFVLTDGGC